jgi:hypothetical protein
MTIDISIRITVFAVAMAMRWKPYSLGESQTRQKGERVANRKYTIIKTI